MPPTDELRAGTLFDLLERAAKTCPDALAIAAPARASLSYAGLFEHTRAMASALGALGRGLEIKRGDRVAIVLPGGAEMATAFLAVSAVAVAAPLNPFYLEREFEFFLRDLRAKAILLLRGDEGPARVVARALGIAILELEPALDAPAGIFSLSPVSHESPGPAAPSARTMARSSDLALVLHTSGTTRRPKIVPLSHGNLVAAARAMVRALELSPHDRCLNVMPLFHIHGLSTVLASITACASVVCPVAFDAERFLDWVEQFSPSWTTAAPTIHHAIREIVEARPELVRKHRFRFLRSASSAMPPSLIAAMERLFQAPFIEAYGMTEASPQIASNPLPPLRRKPGSVGLPAGPEVVILGPQGEKLGVGAIGEVAIRGENVTRGYEGDEDENENENENESVTRDGFLRTGDQGYFDEEGYLFITGRLKEIINRGGEKIAPREIDETLLLHPAVAQAVAFALPHPRLGEDVGAAVVLREGATASPRELQDFVQARLAAFKVPRVVAIVDQIPKGSTAKVQRVGLAERLGLVSTLSAGAFEAPETPTEKLIASIWAEALGRAQVGRFDDFFRLGGDSILAARVTVQIARSLALVGGAILDERAIFRAPTVAELAREADARAAETKASQGAPAPPIARRPEGAPAPLSYMQEGLWFLDRLEPASAAYNIYRAARLRGPLDREAFVRCARALFDRHAALRTIFPSEEGRAIAAFLPSGTLEIEILSLAEQDPEAREREALGLAFEEASRPFDLAQGPLVRMKLLALDPETHVFLFTAHHIILDLTSVGILFRELGALYNAAVGAKELALAPISLEHADFAAWQRQESPRLDAELDYWKTQLAGAPETTPLPFDRPRELARSSAGKRYFFRLSSVDLQAIDALSRSEGTTRFMTLLAAFFALLARVGGGSDLLVGSPVSGRNRPELQGIVGLFTNTIILRAKIDLQKGFRALLARVRETALGAYAHDDVPFDRIVKAVRAKRSAMPLVQVNFRVQGDAVPRDVLEGLELDFLPFDKGNGMAKFDLAMELHPSPRELTGFIEYRSELFDEPTIAHLAEDFGAVLCALTRAPDAPLEALELRLGRPLHQTQATPERRESKPKSMREARRRSIRPIHQQGEGED